MDIQDIEEEGIEITWGGIVTFWSSPRGGFDCFHDLVVVWRVALRLWIRFSR